jgi:predicted esterase
MCAIETGEDTMSVWANLRGIRDLAGRRVFRVAGGAFLTCSLVLTGFGWIESAAVADEGVPGVKGGDSSAVRTAINWLTANQDNSAGRVRMSLKLKAAAIGKAEGLAVQAETPDDFRKIAAESAYPATESPQNLTSEQLDTIAKLAPRSNKAGIKVHPAMVPLFQSMVVRYTGGSYKNGLLRFRLHVPDNFEPGKKYPLVVWLHGAGECGADNINQLSHLHHIIPYLVGPKKRDFFLLVPQCPHTHVSWEAPEICSSTVRGDGSVECHVVDDPIALGNAPIAFTLAMTEAVMKRYPIDPNRVTVGGLSTGGEGTWRILERRPDLFAAAVPLVSWHTMQEKSLREHPILKKIAIWAIYSSDDTAIDFARKDFQRMKDRGCNVQKTEFGVCGHRAWTPAMLQGDIFGWLISRAKDGDRFYSAQSSPTSPEQVGIFADVTEGDLKREPTRAMRPRPTVEASPGRAAEAPIAPRAQPSPQYHPAESYTAPSVVFVDRLRMELIARYIAAGEIKEALAVADKVKNRSELVAFLLRVDAQRFQREVLDYIDRELDRIEQRGQAMGAVSDYRSVVVLPGRSGPVKEEPLAPIPAGKKSPKDDCGKEWAMTPTTLYGLFPSGWDQEAARVPSYIVNETGPQLRDRLAKAFVNDDLAAMKEFCDSFVRLDDIPLSSPWFDTSGGRLQGRIKYTLNDKAKPVVELLRAIARVRAESKQEIVEIAQKSLKRIDAITHPKTDE